MMWLRTADRQQTSHMTASFRIEAGTMRHLNATGQSALENSPVFPYVRGDWLELDHPHRARDKAQHHRSYTAEINVLHIKL